MEALITKASKAPHMFTRRLAPVIAILLSSCGAEEPTISQETSEETTPLTSTLRGYPYNPTTQCWEEPQEFSSAHMGCGNVITYARDEDDVLWRFGDTCIPEGFTLTIAPMDVINSPECKQVEAIHDYDFCGMAESEEACEQMGCEIAIGGSSGTLEGETCSLDVRSEEYACFQNVGNQPFMSWGQLASLYIREKEDGSFEVLYLNNLFDDALDDWTNCQDLHSRHPCNSCL